MKFPDLDELAARNLREAVLRNSLTTLGIGVGVASLVALLSLGVGLQQLVNRSVARTGLFDTVSVRPRQSNPFRGGGGPRPHDASNLEPPRVLDDAARREISLLPNVIEANPEIRFTAEAHVDPRSQLTLVAGMAPSSQSAGTLEGMTGHFFSGPEVEEAIIQGDLAKRLLDDGKAPESLLGREINLRFAQRQALPAAPDPAQPGSAVGPDEEAMGFSIIPGERNFRIVGVIPASDSGGGPAGFNAAGIYVPLATAENLEVVQGSDLREVSRSSTGEGRRYAALNVRASSPAAVAQIESAVRGMGFAAFSLIDVTRNLRTFFAIFDLFLGIFGSLALAVASLGIINTLVMAILERRREIGVLKALGAADRDVRQLFFAEAGVMGLVGGVFGVLLGWGIGRAIHFGTAVYLRRQSLTPPNIWSVPWWLVLGAVVFAVLVSLASGIYPASCAARLDPVQALRYE
jgi:putative ABC transport system permease protein